MLVVKISANHRQTKGWHLNQMWHITLTLYGYWDSGGNYYKPTRLPNDKWKFETWYNFPQALLSQNQVLLRRPADIFRHFCNAFLDHLHSWSWGPKQVYKNRPNRDVFLALTTWVLCVNPNQTTSTVFWQETNRKFNLNKHEVAT